MLQKQKYAEKISIPVHINTFELVLNYFITVKMINRKFIKNVQRLLEVINRRPYESDDYQIFVLSAIEFIAELRCNGVSNLAYIQNAVEESDLDQSFVKSLYKNLSISKESMSKEEYMHLTEVIRDYVDYSHIYALRPKLIEAYDELMTNQGRIKSKSIHKVKALLDETLSYIRKADTSRDSEQSTCLDPKVNQALGNEIGSVYDEITDPCNMLAVGIKELNRFLNGGYKRKRMYIYYAPTNSFKSGILLYNTLWISKFNPNLVPKFPNKTLALLYVTMENDRNETLDRIHAIFTEGQVDPRTISKEMYNKQWTDIILPNLNSNFRIYVRYHAPGMTPADLQGMIEEYEEDDNSEVVGVIIDHLGNMEPTAKTTGADGKRQGLIDLTYELSNYAKTTDRTIITAMHTNSTFDDHINEAVSAGKNNIVRSMGRWCIADAKYIDRAVDQSIYIMKEYSNYDGNWYLGFKYEKVRQKKSAGGNVFYHKLENEITLRYDYGTPYCYSFPAIPGTENALMGQSPGVQYSQQNGQSQPNLDPFSCGNSVPQNASKFGPRVKPVAMTINGNQAFNIEGFGANPAESPIPETYDEEDFSDTDFNRNDVEMVQLMEQDGNTTSQDTLEDIVEESIDDDDFSEVSDEDYEEPFVEDVSQPTATGGFD